MPAWPAGGTQSRAPPGRMISFDIAIRSNLAARVLENPLYLRNQDSNWSEILHAFSYSNGRSPDKILMKNFARFSSYSRFRAFPTVRPSLLGLGAGGLWVGFIFVKNPSIITP